MDIAGLVVHDVEELSYSVDPWQIDMRQMSSGKLNAETATIVLVRETGIRLRRHNV